MYTQRCERPLEFVVVKKGSVMPRAVPFACAVTSPERSRPCSAFVGPAVIHQRLPRCRMVVLIHCTDGPPRTRGSRGQWSFAGPIARVEDRSTGNLEKCGWTWPEPSNRWPHRNLSLIISSTFSSLPIDTTFPRVYSVVERQQQRGGSW